MKKHGLPFIIFLLVLWHFPSFAQVGFSYDQHGNRTIRTLRMIKQADSIAPNDTPSKLENAEVFTDTIDAISFSIFPNPTKEQITINVTGGMQESYPYYSVFDMNGKLIMQQEQIITEQKTIDFSHQESGVYMLVFKYGDTIRVWKIVKE